MNANNQKKTTLHTATRKRYTATVK